MMLKGIIDKYKIQMKGMIHVGVHVANELPEYSNIGIKKLIYVEANPALIENIQGIIKPYADKIDIKLFNIALSDKKTIKPFYITDNIMSSSLYGLEYVSVKDGLRIKKVINVNCDTFNNFIKDNNINLSGYNLLCLDTQGSELDILNNADLSKFDLIQTEVFYQEYYSNGLTYAKMKKLLTSKAFILVKENIATNKKSGDNYFIRREYAS